MIHAVMLYLQIHKKTKSILINISIGSIYRKCLMAVQLLLVISSIYKVNALISFVIQRSMLQYVYRSSFSANIQPRWQFRVRLLRAEGFIIVYFGDGLHYLTRSKMRNGNCLIIAALRYASYILHKFKSCRIPSLSTDASLSFYIFSIKKACFLFYFLKFHL